MADGFGPNLLEPLTFEKVGADVRQRVQKRIWSPAPATRWQHATGSDHRSSPQSARTPLSWMILDHRRFGVDVGPKLLRRFAADGDRAAVAHALLNLRRHVQSAHVLSTNIAGSIFESAQANQDIV